MTAVIRVPGVPNGGTSGQVLAKNSATDQDTGWTTPSAGSNIQPATAVVAETAFGTASAVGTGTNYARNDHTHGSPVHNAAAHSAIPLNSFALPTAPIDMNGQRFVNLLDPFAANESATKNYVDQNSLAPTRLINTTAPLTGGGNLTADRTLGISAFAGSAAGAVPVSAGGTINYLRADGTWAMPAGAMLAQTIQTYPTAAARDAAVPSPAQGACCYITGTGEFLVYQGTNIGWAPPWNHSWGLVANGFQTTATAQGSITNTEVDITGMTTTWPAVYQRVYRATLRCQVQSSVVNDVAMLKICDGSNTQKSAFRIPLTPVNTALGVTMVYYINYGANQTATLKARVVRDSGTGNLQITAGSGSTTNWTVEDVGPQPGTPPI